MTQTLTDTHLFQAGGKAAGVAASYLEFCADHLCQLRRYITKHDRTAVSQIGQALMGNAEAVGLSELSSLGGQLEQYCQGNDWAAIDAAYQAIADTVLTLCSHQGERVKVVQTPDAPPKPVKIKTGS